jgi:HEAT repeat protein
MKRMMQGLKLWRLSSSVKAKGSAQESYSAVLELGRIGSDKAVDLLIGTLARRDGVARSAARELGRLGHERAIKPLAALLTDPNVNQSAAEALIAFGPKAVAVLMETLKSDDAAARQLAVTALGEIRDKRAVEPLILLMQTDDEYAVRTAAATALGLLKDARAVWVLVGTLQMRDETTPERQAALEKLRHATTIALHKIGDPLAAKPATVVDTAAAAVEQVEKKITETEVHPRLIGDLKYLNNGELVGVLKELISASEEISWAKLESREAMLPACFKTYEQRFQTAQIVGKELHRRGGMPLMKSVFEKELSSYGAIGNWWSGIGGWE